LLSIDVVFKTLSDDKSLVLLETIALSGSDTDLLIAKLGLTKREYYSRIRKLIDSNLIIRKDGNYSLTSLGKIVSFYQSRIGRAVNDFWRLKAIDSLCNAAYSVKSFSEEHANLVNKLIDDVEFREILMKDSRSSLVMKSAPLAELNRKASE
jgi:hypothetical protein